MAHCRDCKKYRRNEDLIFRDYGKREQGNCHKKKKTIFRVYANSPTCKVFGESILPLVSRKSQIEKEIKRLEEKTGINLLGVT